MGFALAPGASLEGYRLEAFDTVGSTNALALERARQGDSGRLWIVSRKQESGRGRRGRVWESLEGNLAASLLMVDCCPLPAAATLGFVAGLALGEALDACIPSARLAIGVDGGNVQGTAARFELKWPNDVLAGGAKLAGILLESTMLSADRFAVSIGIGVNVATHPTNLPYPATSLAALGAHVDAETLFLALSDAWTDVVRLWDRGRGIQAVRERWLQRAAGLGSEVAVQINGEVVRGIFETIDEDCRFVIRSRDGRVYNIAAGDVHFGAVASASAS